MEAKFMFRQWMIFGVLAAALALSPAFAFAQDQTSKHGGLAQTGTGGVQMAQPAPVPGEEDKDEKEKLPPAPEETADGMSTGGKVGLVIGGVVVIVGGALAIGGGGGGGGGGAPPGS